MFVSSKIVYVNDHIDTCEIKDTKFTVYIDIPKHNNWPVFLSKFYDEYEKRNMSPIVNTLLLAKHYTAKDRWKYAYDIIMSFLKTKTDQKTIDKYMVLL